MKLLVVEDEIDLLNSIAEHFSELSIDVDTAESMTKAIDLLIEYTYDLVILDINLGDGSGFDVLNTIKDLEQDLMVLILTALDSLEDKVKGLNLGADDYLTKPFHLAELTARVSALQRRKFNSHDSLLRVEDIELDVDKRLVNINKKDVDLTPKEYDILYYMMINYEKVITKEALSSYLWGDDNQIIDSYAFIYTHMTHLRKKMKDLKSSLEIKTIYSIGYKLAGL